MRAHSLVLLAAVCTVALALEDPAQSCAGTASCDVGFCCSSHGFCGRSAYHCSQSSGCNAQKGSCGIVLLDKQDLPRVISYDQLSRDSINDLVKKLTDEGSHVSLDDVKSGKTVEAILQDGLAVKEKMPGASKPATAAPPPNPVPLAQTNVTNKSPEAPKTPDTAAKTPVAGKSGANRLTTGTMGAVMGALVWFLP